MARQLLLRRLGATSAVVGGSLMACYPTPHPTASRSTERQAADPEVVAQLRHEQPSCLASFQTVAPVESAMPIDVPGVSE